MAMTMAAPVLCLFFEVVEKPNGLYEGVRHTSPMHLATRLETRLSFIHTDQRNSAL